MALALAGCASSGSGPSLPPVPSGSSQYVAHYVDWNTFCFDVRRSCFLPFDPLGGKLPSHLKWSTTVDGPVAAQPVLAAGIAINGSQRNVLYFGTANATVYALDADNGTPIWQRAFNDSQRHAFCPDMPDGRFGITSTATFDRHANRLYTVDGEARLHALDLSTGKDTISPLPITTDYHDEHVYGALTLDSVHHTLYVATAGICDGDFGKIPYHGRIVAIDTTASSSAAVVATYEPDLSYPGSFGDGIWGMGGVSISAQGVIYAGVGNALNAPETAGDADKIAAFSYPLQRIGVTAPAPLPGFDVDFGTTPTPAACGSASFVIAPNKSGLLAYSPGAPALSQPSASLPLVVNAPPGPAQSFLGPGAFDWSHGTYYVGVPLFNDGSGTGGISALQFNAGCTLNPIFRFAPLNSIQFGSFAALNKYPMTIVDSAGGQLIYALISSSSTLVAGSPGPSEIAAFTPGASNALWNSGPLITYAVAPPLVDGNLYEGSFLCNGNCAMYAFAP